jgi:catechol 2,3-dioxygenase-like lactoylglutathione lyase family enzyme
MLKTIMLVTLLVPQLATVEAPYREALGYQPVHRGSVSAEQASLWDAPAMEGRPFVILGPASGRPVYLRFVEAPAGTPAPPPAGTTHGWNAVELLTQDPDALAASLPAPFQVVGQPRTLWNAPDAPRAMQALGPVQELLYFTRVIPSGFQKPMRPAETPVDRVFIMVVGGPSMGALRQFYGATLGLPVGNAAPFRITTLSRALGLPAETTYPLATAPLPRDFLIELDEYPPAARSRPAPAGTLPPGVAMVSFGVLDIDAVTADWRTPPRRVGEFPYSGQEAAVTVGPAGEWIELIELAGIPAGTGIGIPVPD